MLTETKAKPRGLADLPPVQAFLKALGPELLDHAVLVMDGKLLGGMSFTHGEGEWSGLIARKGTGERIPSKAIFPADWDGGIVIWSNSDGCTSLKSDDPAVRKILQVTGLDSVFTLVDDANRSRPKPAVPQ